MRTQKKTEDTQAKKVQRERANAILAKASTKTQESVLQNIAALKNTLTNSLDTITNQVNEQLASLKEVQDAVVLQQDNLKQLHDIEVQATTLEDLRVKQCQEKETFEQEMAETRANWDAESEDVIQSRTREQDDYNYNLAKCRKLEKDKYDGERKASQELHDRKIQEVYTEMETRRSALLASENELKTLRDQAATFADTLKKETDKAVAIATNSVKKDLTNDNNIARMELQNKLSLKESELTNAMSRITELQKQNTELDAKYKSATDKVQQIAEKAIEGASKQGVVVNTATDNTDARRK